MKVAVAMQHLQKKAYEYVVDGILTRQSPWESLPTCQGRVVNLVPLCLLPSSSVLQTLLAFTLLSTLLALVYVTLSIMGKTGITQTESPVDDPMFFSIVFSRDHHSPPLVFGHSVLFVFVWDKILICSPV